MSKKKHEDDTPMSNEDMAHAAAKQGQVRETFTNQGNDEKYAVEHEPNPEQEERDRLIEEAQAALPDGDPSKTRPAREIDDTPPPTEGEEQRVAIEEQRKADAEKAAAEQEALMNEVDAKKKAKKEEEDDREHDKKRK